MQWVWAGTWMTHRGPEALRMALYISGKVLGWRGSWRVCLEMLLLCELGSGSGLPSPSPEASIPGEVCPTQLLEPWG